VLFSLEARFTALSGLPTFDTQNDLTAERLLEQLPAYTGEARDAYVIFSAYDFILPLIAGVMVAVLVTLFLRLNTWTIAARLLAWGIPAIFLAATLWDWMENVGLLASIFTDGAAFWVGWALLFKQLKLIWLTLSSSAIFAALALLLANAAIRWAARRG
jgi:hypothetical protein